ncbi:MAG: 16S rRNA (cytidine(1402)-2'-O)-methyltransferase [Clostridiales bacterium]|nr:16S rRNA (cytidine(1402)-2'-O)-methyltransferase [Clostridiales bacterium]
MAKGKLYLVGTPIGNLEDISFRAVRILGEADLIAAEDTRVSGRLLNALNIKRPLISYYEHNKTLRGEELLSRLQAGEHIALISDAGMPGISDPGADLLRLAVEAGIEAVVVPGPNAALGALVLSGLDSRRFTFEGFLPREGGKRRAALAALAAEQRTMVFYEAPHRVLATLNDMAAAFGANRQAAAGRELTKLHEEMLRGSLGELADHFAQTAPRGEFTLVLAGSPPVVPKAPQDNELAEELAALIKAGRGRKEAAKALAQKYGLSVKHLYGLGLE